MGNGAIAHSEISYGPARKHLGNRYHTRFATHWDFVRYAQERHLDLDFTTPPKRPNLREWDEAVRAFGKQ